MSNPNPNRENRLKKFDSKKPKGEKKGKRVARLTSPSSTPARAGKRKAGRKGHGSPGSGHRGAAARPLDGGALTRWGARTPARGRRRRRDLAASPWSLGDELRREEVSSEAKRESVRVKMKLGLREARSAGVFDAPSCALRRRSEING